MELLPEALAPVALAWYWRIPRHGCQGLGCVLSQGIRVRQTRLTGGEILPTRNYRDGEKTGAHYSHVWFFLDWWSLLFSQEWWGHIRYKVLGSPTVCSWRKMGHMQIFWVVIGSPRYPGYMTPTNCNFIKVFVTRGVTTLPPKEISSRDYERRGAPRKQVIDMMSTFIGKIGYQVNFNETKGETTLLTTTLWVPSDIFSSWDTEIIVDLGSLARCRK
jgi:hypothetical protein